MNKIAKKELEALASAVEYFEAEGIPLADSLRSLLDKFNTKAKDTDDPNCLSPAKVENALVKFSNGKVVPVVAARSIFWIKQYQVWKQLAPTVDQVETVARWFGRQGWLSPMTIDQVGYKWTSYLARAMADPAGNKPQGTNSRKEFTGED